MDYLNIRSVLNLGKFILRAYLSISLAELASKTILEMSIICNSFQFDQPERYQVWMPMLVWVELQSDPDTYLHMGRDLRSDYYYRATLDSDGAARSYKHSNASSWSVVQAIPDDMCSIGTSGHGCGISGFNSY